MNQRQRIIQERFLDNEDEVIRRLKKAYKDALTEVEKKAQVLQNDIDRLSTLSGLATDAEEKARLLSMEQSKVYQKQYQDALKKQISSILDDLQVKEFATIDEYLKTCYEDGYIGTFYDMQGQGIPLIVPIDQEAVVQAVQLDSKISKGLYTRLGEDVAKLKRKITSEVSRAIATGVSYGQIAKNLERQSNIGYNNAVRIARTEGHRVQTAAAMDACQQAQDRGADVVKQWDATFDSRTRESHGMVDGEIRELNEKFSNGLMYPGGDGPAHEVINCRCALLQRARWATTGGFTKYDGFTKEIKKFKGPEEYAAFKKAYFSPENMKYMKFIRAKEEEFDTKDFRDILARMDDEDYAVFERLQAARPQFNGMYRAT